MEKTEIIEAMVKIVTSFFLSIFLDPLLNIPGKTVQCSHSCYISIDSVTLLRMTLQTSPESR